MGATFSVAIATVVMIGCWLNPWLWDTEMDEKRFEARLHARRCAVAHACEWFSPEGTKTHTADHVEHRVKYDQAQQQVEEHGLWDWDRKFGIISQCNI